MSEGETGIQQLDRLYPTRYGSGDLIGLGQFILNIVENPGDPETDAENIALAILTALDDAEGRSTSSSSTTSHETK